MGGARGPGGRDQGPGKVGNGRAELVPGQAETRLGHPVDGGGIGMDRSVSYPRRPAASVRLRLTWATIIALIAVLGPAAGGSADPKTGCPVGTGWNEMTVEDVAARVWPALVDQSPWEDEADFRESASVPTTATAMAGSA